MSLAETFVTVRPNLRSFSHELTSGADRAAASAGGHAGHTFGSKFHESSKELIRAAIGTIGIVEGARFLGEAVRGSLEEAEQSNKVGKVTDQIIKTTGASARVTRKHIEDLSMAIAKKIGVDDEEIQAGANMLLTFKNIRNEAGKNNDIFDRTVQLSRDMSTALGLGVPQATKVLGKALNDPIKGMTALGRVGVTFTDQQKKNIKAMVESGHTMDAQKMILSALEGRFKGVAAASATPAEKARVAWKNLQESFGNQILPVLEKAADWFTETGSPALYKFGDAVKGAFKYLGDHREEVIAVLSGIGTAFAFWQTLNIAKMIAGIGSAIKGLLISIGPIGWVAVALGAVAGAFVYAYRNSETFREKVDAVVQWFKGVVKPFTDAAKFIFSAFWDQFNATDTDGKVQPFFQRLGSAFRSGGQVLVQYLAIWGEQLWTWIKDATPKALAALADYLKAFYGWFYGTAIPAAAAWLADMGWKLVAWIEPRIVPTLKALGNWLGQAGAWFIGTAIPGLLGWLEDMGGRLVAWIGPRVGPTLRALGGWLGHMLAWIVGTGIPRLVVGLVTMGAELIKWIAPRIPGLIVELVKFQGRLTTWIITKGIPGLVKAMWTFGTSAIGSFVKAMKNTDLGKLGGQLLDDLGSGLTSFGKKIAGWASRIKDAIVGAIKHLFGINSPSRVMFGLGTHMIDGLLNALTAGRGAIQHIAQTVFGGPLDIVRKAGSGLGNLLRSVFPQSTGFGAGVGRWAGLVSTVLSMLGQSQKWLPVVLQRIAQESGGNPNAVNLWDVNAQRGDPSKGLMQTISSTFRAYAGQFRGLGIFNPLANIYAGLNYAIHRYGTLAALARPGGYDSGGWLRPGQTGANFGTRPERVLSSRQTDLFDRLVALLEQGGIGGGGPRTLVLVDADGHLIGRMRAEAGDVLDEELAAARWGEQ